MKLAVFFPGIGYHCDKPLLYYSRKVVEKLGYDEIISLSYTYRGENIRGNEEKMKEAFSILYAQAKESLKSVSFQNYDEILFVSKSVGTIIASAYATENKLQCNQILYTPLEYTFAYPHENAIAFIGTADPWSNVNKVIDMAKADNVPIHVYHDVNHSLEGDDVNENIEIVKAVMEESYRFMNAFIA